MVQKKRTVRSARTTVLLVCEGPTDKAFLDYLKQSYCSCGHGGVSPKLTFKPAGGKGANHVISKLIAHAKNADYDKLVAMYDVDMVPSADQLALLQSKSGIAVPIEPHCLEGMLLQILSKPIPHSSEACKNIMHPLLVDPMDCNSYARYFERTLLDKQQENIPSLKILLSLFK